MCQFDEVWNYISSKGSSQAQVLKVRSEVLFAILGAPLFHTWLGARIDEVTTCSDASQTGGAVAIARSLTVDGKGFLEIQERTNMPMEVPIVVISLFNGIGGAARCYDVAGVKVRAFLACDIHKPSNRTTARRWPDTIFWEDVRTLTKEKLRELLEHVEDFEEIHAWAGFPCVDLSSVRANRMNLEGKSSGLIREAHAVFQACRVISLLKMSQAWITRQGTRSANCLESSHIRLTLVNKYLILGLAIAGPHFEWRCFLIYISEREKVFMRSGWKANGPSHLNG